MHSERFVPMVVYTWLFPFVCVHVCVGVCVRMCVLFLNGFDLC